MSLNGQFADVRETLAGMGLRKRDETCEVEILGGGATSLSAMLDHWTESLPARQM
jgi:hypothetical protein